MEYVTNGLKPEKLFRFFEDISRIPRGSGNEGAIADFIEDFAKSRGLFARKDNFSNVLIRKPASPGREDEPPIMLQGHTDMVCEKISSSNHDFTRDPLDLKIEGGKLKANGTTLGADDGIAVAAMLAVLDSDEITHPELECLFTSSEETGMYGAFGFDYSDIKSRKIINIDSEAEGVVTCGCAGGVRINLSINTEKIPVPSFGKALKISIGGLAGGHSGTEINMRRANAIYLAGRVISMLGEKDPVNLLYLKSGKFDNVIAQTAELAIFAPEPAVAKERIAEIEKILRSELSECDKKFKIKVNAETQEHTMLTFADTRRVADAVLLCPTGVLGFCRDDRTIPETSSNIGVAKTDDDRVTLCFLARSSSESRLDEVVDKYRRVAKAIGADIEFKNRYPGWEYNAKSELRELYLKVASRVLGEVCTPRAEVIHAGLECGVISSALGGADAISIGPDIEAIHTPKEALDIASTARLWDIITAMLAEKNK